MISDLFEPGPPRFKGAPPICIATNLLSFPTKEAALKFHEARGPGNTIKKIGKCSICNHWHYTITMRPPSGSSSGTGREDKGR